MKFLFASDSFKGSLSSSQILSLLEDTAHQVFPDCETVGIPVADGGEGTVEALVTACRGQMRTVTVTGPLGEPVRASYGLLGDGTAVIEMAAASGLPLVPLDRRNPSRTTTAGTGELMLDAAAQGCKRIVLAIGGSATNDGGTGMLSALGITFWDAQGNRLTGTGGELSRVERIESHLHPAIASMPITVMCDVTSPLLGPEGASRTFGPQKGADPAMVERLEAGMAHYASVVCRQTGRDCTTVPGSGAAGGLGFGLLSFLPVEVKSGIETVLELLEFDRLLEDVDLVVTGEGRLDWQSALGKVPAGIGDHCRRAGIPAVAIVGSIGPGYESIFRHGICSVMPTVSGPMPLEEAMADASRLYADAALRTFRLIQAAGRLKG